MNSTLQPTIEDESTPAPSAVPTKSPVSAEPTAQPSSSTPTGSPTKSPHSSAPTGNPTKSPHSSKPTAGPSHGPSAQPTKSPRTSLPTNGPSRSPHSSLPTMGPTRMPTGVPTPALTTSYKDTVIVLASDDRMIFVSVLVNVILICGALFCCWKLYCKRKPANTPDEIERLVPWQQAQDRLARNAYQSGTGPRPPSWDAQQEQETSTLNTKGKEQVVAQTHIRTLFFGVKQ